MRKILKLITPLLAMLVLLTACSSEKTKVYTKSIDNQDLQVTIYYKGDSVNKIVSENTLTVSGDDINSAIESIKKLIILLDILIKLRKKMGKFILHGKQTLIN